MPPQPLSEPQWTKSVYREGGSGKRNAHRASSHSATDDSQAPGISLARSDTKFARPGRFGLRVFGAIWSTTGIGVTCRAQI